MTASSPLQYQKDLRLLEARRLIKAADVSVTTAAYDVGYESPNQFSREYSRKFGHPPKSDVGSSLAKRRPAPSVSVATAAAAARRATSTG